ncbi:hypothetical protein F5883DRAFT_691577 [Diaporthe sp. PMI_573]|nr:hypothetical protein F5883DRAFT_691577 [Diaporthaceae sp. PMI_573]
MKIARRMRWKLPFLGQAYRAATDRDLNTLEDRAEAELMFKLDFFEYYMLLERALVHLMGVFGVKITGAFTAASRRPAKPPHPVLGAGDARYALARAKELRNRWKNADEPDSITAITAAGATITKLTAARPLEDYDLERILESIFGGLEGAYVIAERYVAGVRALASERGSAAPGSALDNGVAEEAQWEFMVDAMDWEAV